MESGGNLVVDSHVMNEGNPWAGSGANPWHLDQDTESILFLTNESEQPARVGFKLNANGGPSYFLTSLLLNPHETRALDLRKLRDAQKPDFKKNKVPAAAADGSVIWIRGDNLPVMGRLMLIHRRQGMASNYDCNQCACPYTYDPVLDHVDPDGANLLVGGTQPLTFYGGFQDCTHADYYYNENGSTTWKTGDSSVLTVDSSGLVTAQGSGTTTITGQFSGYAYVWNQMMYYCSHSLLQGQASVTIAAFIPQYAVFKEDGAYSSGCGNGKYRDYEAYDSAPSGGHLIQSAMDWTIHETGNPACGMNLGGTETGEVTFTDQIANCQAGCTAQIDQTFSVVYKGHTYGLQARDCPTCTVHNGWHLTVTTTSPYVTVTDN